MNTTNQHVSINHGVNFERAIEVLNADAGRAFRQLQRAKKDGASTPAQLAELQQACIAAQREVEALDRNDGERINQILEMDRV